jgi:hypothetical protein
MSRGSKRGPIYHCVKENYINGKLDVMSVYIVFHKNSQWYVKYIFEKENLKKVLV